jgi:HK97 gp10 family phage protein
VPLVWHGELVEERIIAACKIAVDATTAECVNHAKTNHPWTNRTGTLEGSIMARPAEEEGLAVVGEWGSFDVNYAIFLELGTSKMPPYPYLRPAADACYPHLAGRIAAASAL